MSGISDLIFAVELTPEQREQAVTMLILKHGSIEKACWMWDGKTTHDGHFDLTECRVMKEFIHDYNTKVEARAADLL